MQKKGVKRVRMPPFPALSPVSVSHANSCWIFSDLLFCHSFLQFCQRLFPSPKRFSIKEDFLCVILSNKKTYKKFG